MKPVLTGILAGVAIVFASPHAGAQVAGTTTLKIGDAQMEHIAVGWSVKKQILGQTVYNEEGKKVGTVDDLIVAPDNAVSYAIVGASSFAGLKNHDVAIPVNLLADDHGKLVLPGATKDAIKSLPEFKYARKK